MKKNFREEIECLKGNVKKVEQENKNLREENQNLHAKTEKLEAESDNFKSALQNNDTIDQVCQFKK